MNGFQFELDLEKTILLIFTIAVLVIGLYYSSIIGNWGFGDESYYFLSAKTIVDTRNPFPPYIPHLYSTGTWNESGLFMEKEPLNYWIPTLFYIIGNGNAVVYKSFPTIFLVLTIIIVYYFVKEIYNKRIALLAAILTGITPLIFHFTIITYLNVPIVFFFTLSAFSVYKAISVQTRKWIILAGIILGMSFLISKLTFFIPLGILIYLVASYILSKEKLFQWISNNKKEIKSLFLIGIIGISFYVPIMVRNIIMYHNPFFPEFSQLSDYYMTDRAVAEIHESSARLIDVINPRSLWVYYGFLYILFFFAALFALFNIDKKNIYFLSILIVAILPIFLSRFADIRYTMQAIPILALLSSVFIYALFQNQKYKILEKFFMLVLIIILIYGIYFIREDSSRLNELRDVTTGQTEAYAWIVKNTPENSTIMDIYTMNALFLLYQFDQNNQRTVTFLSPALVGSSELIDFWTKDTNIALQSLENQGINYIVIQKVFFRVLKEFRKMISWYHLPEEFIQFTQNNPEHFKLVYDTQDISIYEVVY